MASSTNPVNTTDPAQQQQLPPSPPVKTWGQWFVENYNAYVNRVDANTFAFLKVKSNFGIDTEATPAVTACTKVIKVFAMVISSVILFPLACLGGACSFVKETFWGSARSPAHGPITPPGGPTGNPLPV